MNTQRIRVTVFSAVALIFLGLMTVGALLSQHILASTTSKKANRIRAQLIPTLETSLVINDTLDTMLDYLQEAIETGDPEMFAEVDRTREKIIELLESLELYNPQADNELYESFNEYYQNALDVAHRMMNKDDSCLSSLDMEAIDTMQITLNSIRESLFQITSQNRENLQKTLDQLEREDAYAIGSIWPLTNLFAALAAFFVIAGIVDLWLFGRQHTMS